MSVKRYYQGRPKSDYPIKSAAGSSCIFFFSVWALETTIPVTTIIRSRWLSRKRILHFSMELEQREVECKPPAQGQVCRYHVLVSCLCGWTGCLPWLYRKMLLVGINGLAKTQVQGRVKREWDNRTWWCTLFCFLPLTCSVPLEQSPPGEMNLSGRRHLWSRLCCSGPGPSTARASPFTLLSANRTLQNSHTHPIWFSPVSVTQVMQAFH